MPATIKAGLAARLASFNVSDARIAELSKAVQKDGLSIKNFDVCSHGICVDYFTTDIDSVAKLVKEGKFKGIEIFPWGIVNPDLFHVKVGLDVPELAGRVAQR
ncbi:hypothetical protein [Methylocystis parvus]|uniref:Uncharacterized protein n=1 Tax=Methylocystis parvus TaxID=134 RepID=A0A6B8MAB6_9HYPH|nr:hypothetical protein [Methylocystis parvus]QGM98539.1 hypothetical protein F7D14_14355 [Methylocystis parvus]WBK01121.1 hypothetical protein MMG94_05215 [Methylocystis parvus OBBP]